MNSQHNRTNIREVIIDGVRYHETILIENSPVLHLSANNRFGVINTRSVLDFAPEGFEEIPLAQALQNESRAHEMVIDSLENAPIVETLQEFAMDISTIEEQREAILTQVTTNSTRVARATQEIMNHNGIWDYLFRFLINLQELPMFQRVLLAGGTIALVIGGIYIGIKLIRRNGVNTTVTPFGSLSDNNLTFIGVGIRRFTNYINTISIRRN